VDIKLLEQQRHGPSSLPLPRSMPTENATTVGNR
jgi:hypothetical protein